MKKIFLILIITVFSFCSLVGCETNKIDKNQNDNIQIVTTIFPEYDWVKNILGDNPSDIEVTMLLDNGVDLHSFQATASDILKISNCDLFIYVDGESDDWVDDSLKEVINQNIIVINLMEILGDDLEEEKIIEGMQEEHDHEHEHKDDHEEEIEYDEHIWLSLKNAKVLVKEIAKAIEKIDDKNKDIYENNLENYLSKLESLDKEYQDTIANANYHTLLFGDRFPFVYLLKDYDLDYYAAFVGCSAETEASFETIAFLSNKVDELGLNTILKIEGTNHKIAETIVSNTKEKNQQILTLDSMQSKTSKDVKQGANYLDIMKYNLSVIKEATK